MPDREAAGMSEWTFPENVKGWLTANEGAALARLAAGKIVLEVGSFCGRSTVCMAQTAKEVHSVDHHRGDHNSGAGGTLEAFKANLDAYGVADRVRVNVESFGRYVGRLNGDAPAFELAFIDGAHDVDSVAHDAAAALRLVRPGGVVAFHDWDWSSVREGAGRAHPVFAGPLAGRAGNVAAFTVPEPNHAAMVAASVEVCIPLRSENVDGDVLMKAHTVCQFAARQGIACELTRVVDS